MNKLIFGIIIVMVLFSLSSFAQIQTSAQNPLTAFGENLRSGKLSQSLADLGKNTIFLWYTTVAGELNPEYQTQRMILDGFLFFIIFFVIVRFGIKRIWGDMEKSSKEMLSLAISAALTIAFLSTNISIGFLLPYVNNIMFFALTGLLAFLINSGINKDKKTGKFLQAILIAAIISFLLVNVFNFIGGKSVSLIGNTYDTERKSDFAMRLVGSAGGMTSSDPATNYAYAIASVQNYDYQKAQDYFAAVVDSSRGDLTNEWVKKTQEWITQSGGDKLFRHMAQHLPPLMELETEAANNMLSKAEGLSNVNPNKKELLLKARSLAEDVIEQEKLLAAEFDERKIT